MSNKKKDSPILIHKYYFSFEKRIFDVVISILGLIFGMPIYLPIALLIFISSGWPIIYIQKRAGKKFRTFNIYKFRTMKILADAEKKKYSHLNQAPWPMFKIFDDPRFTKIGKFLSKTGIDEIPQLINILKGEMSFIGPRPLPINEANELMQVDPDFNFRFQVKPGVFSEWGLSENRHKSLEEWKKLDGMTLKKGGLIYEAKIVIKMLIKILPLRYALNYLRNFPISLFV